MFTNQGLHWYGLRRGSIKDHQEICGICGHEMEDPCITSCGHKFDFACITIAIHAKKACPHPGCTQILWQHCNTTDLPNSYDLVKYSLRVARMYDFREFCRICTSKCKDPVITRCGHLFDMGCIKDRIESGASSCPAPNCTALLWEHKTKDSGPPRFAQADQDEASFRQYARDSQKKLHSSQMLIYEQQWWISVLRVRYEADLAQIEHIRQAREPGMQSQLQEAHKEAANTQTTLYQGRQRYEENAKESRAIQGRCYSDGGREEFMHARKSLLAKDRRSTVKIDNPYQVHNGMLIAGFQSSYWSSVRDRQDFKDAVRDVQEAWFKVLHRRRGLRMFRSDFLDLLGVETDNMQYYDKYADSRGVVDVGLWCFLRDMARAGALLCAEPE